MDSRDIVREAIRFQKPPKLPVNTPSMGVSDIAGLPLKPPASFHLKQQGEDGWGCIWKNAELPNVGQIVGHPLLDLSRLDSHPLADYIDDRRYVDVEPFLETAWRNGKYDS